MTKSGIGYDVHPLAEGETLVIGGVKIDSTRGSVGHSDGDVLLHAIVDALLGAVNLGDIGQHFPSSDDRWKGKESIHFLEHAAELVRNEGFEIDNLDSTVILEEPKLSEIIPEMVYKISYTLQIDKSAVSIKATTTDKMGFIGRGEGVGAVAVATISN
ncbi:MAG TPA: 2-C-methyl-D-erythritol 2,4-cyclodiphosphate synthase [Candidatus Marinimicrobia bacterium]|jgi:2-C-methyl-D-erythritol 2,4-cyclodiphosphate synthase|nr:2-C-methyl-D-erythritol 2,4-cyclodiphosphate synthase [Candidatus Neomarinimicrobiota bacterium]MDP7330206.1 2-C-methyl-D-erythritol 2,4-cyclodiphosphate synthase [Candidatus Neomarinimicrobiota bacterium]HBN45550.1 2-C-methyl-D-erythritol 2,4-cyclodiphosphate synthase [Candidatus Neomarinimicrobiota bacterium]HJL74433.1 2-C-methyl-D-erythritol 2,4-cyclodiphosphate synthase [Candidatus Neomarinimicrobiota bacterium]HJM69293.1 2-C-methyl-D-erythritol 2,4-cyclodiphosphate synthase [Candidatus |tara:strand:+ start:30667 stop:31140 length:474 start_codon:yes stop_codon:yes gene_type:complete